MLNGGASLSSLDLGFCHGGTLQPSFLNGSLRPSSFHATDHSLIAAFFFSANFIVDQPHDDVNWL
ncbi:unnamed protein product [Trifolium pratense]|uniref:Uncharacterized protein n=1 Tax=Trifolium pratense TaxID=57577 RepID=A0ACB0M8F1_TRIPR|nr:unnamed protein product [Trifolium pratense]